MSLSSEITRLQNAKSALKTSIEAKGVPVSDSTLISDYSAYVDQIPTGGGGGGDDILRDLIERDITTLNIPSGTTKIGESAFGYCSALTSVTIPNSVTSIGDYAFSKCTGLTSVTIPNSVTSIGNEAFRDCSALTSVTIPNSVTKISSNAFFYCSGLTSVTIPNSVTEIGGYAFRGCSGLTKVEISDIAAWCNINFYSEQSNPIYYAHHLYLNEKEVTNVVISNSVTRVGSYLFFNCIGLTSVTIPNSVKEIGNSVFESCTGLTSVTIEATTPPTLGDSNVFNNTNNCPIYVPDVEAYSQATNWSALASRIQPIPTE